MAPPTKSSDGRRKSGGKPTLLVTLSVPSSQLREILDDEEVDVAKEESPAAASETKEIVEETKESPEEATSTPAATANGAGDGPSDSNVATPAADGTAEGTPAPSVMGPPGDGPGPKKKGVKRSAAGTNGTVDGVPKVRGKPGPKKKPRLYVLNRSLRLLSPVHNWTYFY